MQDKSVKKTLFFTPSNLGDVILSLPVLDHLRENFPGNRITVMVGPKARDIFSGNPQIERIIVYDKHALLRDKFKLFCELWSEGFDAVIDLRNSLFGALLPCRYRTSPLLRIPAYLTHLKDRNLYRLYKALGSKNPLKVAQERIFDNASMDARYVEDMLARKGIRNDDKIVLINYMARGATKQWSEEKFTQLCVILAGKGYKAVLIGSAECKEASSRISASSGGVVYDFTGLTTLKQLAYLLKKCVCIVSCDTGTLQLASYMDAPIVGIYGASFYQKFGPWSRRREVLFKGIACSPCQKAQCQYATVQCLESITPEEVSAAVERLSSGVVSGRNKGASLRILVCRTDRIGDVVLTTPVFGALRAAYPDAYIAAMVSAKTKDIVEGNPNLDEVIVYDKESLKKSVFNVLKFASEIKKKGFGLALALHPVKRVHILLWLAGIPRRIGYARKLGFLLTEKIVDEKHMGERHELDYNLDFVRYLGFEPKEKELFMPLNADSEEWAAAYLKENGIKDGDRLLAVAPGASCRSKIWPAQRFSEVADKLSKKYGFKTLVISGPGEQRLKEAVVSNMRSPVLGLSQDISISQLAGLIKRCRLFISNDSGPVHIASALGVPVVSIFGRNQKGLSPARWAPAGRSRFLHRNAGCVECLAHNCAKGFLCLNSVTAKDVFEAASELLDKGD